MNDETFLCNVAHTDEEVARITRLILGFKITKCPLCTDSLELERLMACDGCKS